jgi:hypothetical protein
MRSRFALIILATLALSEPGLAQDHHATPPAVSIVQLLSSPEKYEGKRVVAFGFLTIGDENDNLYFGKTDFDNDLLVNSIWVDVSKEMLKKIPELNMRYVRIVGVFHSGHEGRRALSVGGIGEISDCSVLSDPDHPFSEKLKGLVHHDPSPDPRKPQ